MLIAKTQVFGRKRLGRP